MGTAGTTPVTARLVGHSDVVVWGLTGAERLRRAFRRAGVALAGDEGSDAAGTLVLARVDFIYDESLIRALLASPGCLLTTGAAQGDRQPVAAHLQGSAQAADVEDLLLAPRNSESALTATSLKTVGPMELAGSHNSALRKRVAPYLLSLSELSPSEVERQMFDGAYKGVTDFVTKRIWPIPALAVTRACARTRVSPNAVTFVSLLFVLLAMWLFWIGQFGAGLCAAWMMCFLDTVDGKLARVTLTSTPMGNVFDHGIDLIHPPFWYYAWYHGLQLSGASAAEVAALWIVILGYVGGRLQEGLFLWMFGFEIHTWRPIDSRFREITARRNPNLFILSIAVVFGAPHQGFLAVAVWTIASFVFHSVRILQAGVDGLRGRTPASWLAEPLGAAQS